MSAFDKAQAPEEGGLGPVLSYESLVENFKASLVNTLRSHGADFEELSLWVPDEDPVKSILNMLDAIRDGGRPSFALSVDRKTIDEDAVRRLAGAAREFCDFEVDENDGGYLLRAANFRVMADRRREIRDAQVSERLTAVEYQYGQSHAVSMPEAYRQVAIALANDQRNIGVQSPPGCPEINVEDGGVRMTIVLSRTSSEVICLRYEGQDSPEMTGVLEALARLSPGQPLQELAEHGVSRLLHFLRENSGVRPVGGILLPWNAGPEVARIHRLLQKLLYIRDQQLKVEYKTGDNTFDLPPSPRWLAATESERELWVKAAIGQLEQQKDLQAGVIKVSQIAADLAGWPVRISVEIGADIDLKQRPALVREIERYLKLHVESKLQVYYVERKDANKIRRL